MRFMNTYDIDEARERWVSHPILGPATQTLSNLRDAANANSDGWAYWPKPARAAAKLMELIEGDGTNAYRFGDREDATPTKLRAALTPIRSFRTRQGLQFEIIDRFENRYRVISENHGLVWTGDEPEEAENVALMSAINTARTVYLQDGTES